MALPLGDSDELRYSWRYAHRYMLRAIVDVQTDERLGNFVGFYTCDISLNGICTMAPELGVFDRICGERPVGMKVWLSDLYGVVNLHARLRWKRIEERKVWFGWSFVQIDSANLQKIRTYISDHPKKQIANNSLSEKRRTRFTALKL